VIEDWDDFFTQYQQIVRKTKIFSNFFLFSGFSKF